MKSHKFSAYNTTKNIKLKHKKHEITEENTIMATIISTPKHEVIKIYHRSNSEELRAKEMERKCCNLRRTNTETKWVKKSCGCCKDANEGQYPVDHLSNDEFRMTIEDFIAKQRRFLKEEEVTP